MGVSARSSRPAGRRAAVRAGRRAARPAAGCRSRSAVEAPPGFSHPGKVTSVVAGGAAGTSTFGCCTPRTRHRPRLCRVRPGWQSEGLPGGLLWQPGLGLPLLAALLSSARRSPAPCPLLASSFINFHRMTERSGLEGTSVGHPVQSLLTKTSIPALGCLLTLSLFSVLE